MDLFTGVLMLIIAVVCYIKRRSNPVYSIPGPFSLPILGTWFDLSKAHLTLHKWAEEFGDVLRISILTEPVVVLSSYDTVCEALLKRKSDFSGRPKLFRAETLKLDKGLGFTPHDSIYKLKRKLTVQGVKFVGAARMALQNVIAENIQDLLTVIEEKVKAQKPFNLLTVLTKYYIKVIISVVFGQDVPLDSPVLDELMLFNKLSVQIMSLGKEELDIFPELRFVDPNYSTLKKVSQDREKVLKPLYYKLKALVRPTDSHCLMAKWQEAIDAGTLTDTDCLGILNDVIIAGVVSSSTLTQLAIGKLVEDQNMQRRMQQEIDEAILAGNLPSVTDKPYMPFSEAFVLELLRYQSPLPFSIPHMTTQDTEVAGHKINKNTWVFINLWSVLHDETIYRQPYDFIPERFLDAEGHVLPHSHPIRKQNIAFGIGDRKCVAEALAMNRLFLTITALFQKFNFNKSPHCPLPSLDPREIPARILLEYEDFSVVGEIRG